MNCLCKRLPDSKLDSSNSLCVTECKHWCVVAFSGKPTALWLQQAAAVSDEVILVSLITTCTLSLWLIDLFYLRLLQMVWRWSCVMRSVRSSRD